MTTATEAILVTTEPSRHPCISDICIFNLYYIFTFYYICAVVLATDTACVLQEHRKYTSVIRVMYSTEICAED